MPYDGIGSCKSIIQPVVKEGKFGRARIGAPVEMPHQRQITVPFNWQLPIRVLDCVTANAKVGAL
jgi:hypothetical protein